MTPMQRSLKLLRVCAVPDCERQATHKEWCKMHYGRWLRHGDPTFTLISPKSSGLPQLLAMIEADGDECRLWTRASTHGYGVCWIDGRNVRTHVYACEYRNGPRPLGMAAAHSCGNRACVNPAHLRWATQAENEADKRLHGRVPAGDRHHGTKLKEVDALRAAAMVTSGWTIKATADYFGVSPTAMRERLVRGART